MFLGGLCSSNASPMRGISARPCWPSELGLQYISIHAAKIRRLRHQRRNNRFNCTFQLHSWRFPGQNGGRNIVRRTFFQCDSPSSSFIHQIAPQMSNCCTEIPWTRAACGERRF